MILTFQTARTPPSRAEGANRLELSGCSASDGVAFQGKLLKSAIEICGGWDAFCARLLISEHRVKFWMDGKARMPEEVFLKVADIVLEDGMARAREDRRARPRIAALPTEEEEPAPPSSDDEEGAKHSSPE